MQKEARDDKRLKKHNQSQCIDLIWMSNQYITVQGSSLGLNSRNQLLKRKQGQENRNMLDI